MADPKMAETMKLFASNITSSSVKERVMMLKNLHPFLAKSDFPENGIKGIVKHLLFTLWRYEDSKSRHAVDEIITVLAATHPSATTKILPAAMSDLSESLAKTSVSPTNSAAAMSALGWICAFIRTAFKTAEDMKGSDFQKLLAVKSLLTSAALASSRKSICKGTYNRLRRVWIEVPGSVHVYADQCSRLAENPLTFCLIGCIFKFLSSKKDQDSLAKYKKMFIEFYIKTIIGSRNRVPPTALRSCNEFLKLISREEFKSQIMPALDRSMLRNPEIVLNAFCHMIGGLKFEMSPYALDVGKHLATQCHAKDDNDRELASATCRQLAHLCSDQESVEKLVKHFFAVLNGSEGKLTVVPQRLGLLTAIGNLSYNTVSGNTSVQKLTSSVAELFIPFLQQEVHEGTLVHALTQLSLWCAKFSSDVPEKLTQWFKTAFTLKSSTSAVRAAYLLCIDATYSGDSLMKGACLLPLLDSTLEKALAQSTMYSLVFEALIASTFMAKLSMADIQVESKMNTFWSAVLDGNKQMFVNDKFLSQASDEGLKRIATLVRRLIIDYPQKMTPNDSRLYYKAMVFALTHGGYESRKHTHIEVKKMTNTLGGSLLACDLIKQFRNILLNEKLLDYDNIEEGTDVKFIKPRILTEALITLSTVLHPEPKEAESIAMETLYDAHHPCIVSHCSDCWVNIVASLKLDARQLIESNIKTIEADIKNTSSVSANVQNAVCTLVRIAPSAMTPIILSHVNSLLKTDGLMRVTPEEVNIMNWPEGDLYDKSVIEEAGSGSNSTANMKRESKLYSYADQMEALELKKELERKKGKKEVPKLSKKQIDARNTQMSKEKEIRERLLDLDRHVTNACSLLEACLLGDPSALRIELPDLLRLIFPLLKSPLAAPHLAKFYVQMRSSVFVGKDPRFALQLTQVCLRSMQPHCSLDSGWEEEAMNTQASRAITRLHLETCRPRTRDKSHLLLAPSFAFCFPLLHNVLSDRVAGLSDDQVKIKCFAIISAHCEMREEKASAVVDETGPELLPREEIFQLCCKLIGMSSGRLQQEAAKTLLDAAASGSGREGCASAMNSDIAVLLEAVQSSSTAVRESTLKTLLELILILPTPDIDPEMGLDLVRRVWVSKYDSEDLCRSLADKLWQDADLECESELCAMIVNDVVHDQEAVRLAAADALAAALSQHSDQVDTILQMLLSVYEDKSYMPPPEFDSLGRLVSEPAVDQWPARSGVAMALCKLSPLIPDAEVETLFQFFVQKGLADRAEGVRKEMLNAAVAALNDHSKDNVNTLLPVLESFLGNAPNTATFDSVRQSIVILMGTLAKHLDKDNPKVKPIVGKLIETLSTPSQQVQEAIANCLPPLVPAIKEDAPLMVKSLLTLLLESENYGERKGAAYGLAGLVKGLGILVLKQLNIMTTLTEAIQNKKNPRHREGALFSFEMLCLMLGRLFEPYVVHLLPHLLLCFGDTNQYVREAADDTAKAIMSKLSAHGVKLVLPSLLTALEEDSWRTKTGSVELLGAMAFCAPKQLSACLPSIVPKLTEVLSDSHHKVQKAGAQALKQIGSVIKNPEIQAIVPILLGALQDPTKKTTTALQRLLETKFVHFIDAPSLALIMPVVQRSFQDRSTETRKMAAQIIGNMYSLTDQKDLAPYLPSVIPGLKASLLDPVPEVRSVSSRALGAMVKGMGENGFEELVPWLMTTLTHETSSVDRSGAAQGLSEVVGSLGLGKLQKLMPDIIQTAERMDIAPHVRDGYIMMFIFLPTVFGDDFMPYVGPIIPSILKALADETEYVRDTALRAGQRIVNTYADTAIELLMPELENGLFDDNWRIRYSSVQLLGDLLYKISGVSGKMTTESAGDDDTFGTENSQKAVLGRLGNERRNRVLAGLYMGRSDTALMVRQAALHVWKIIVSHTPKTLREILPTLFQLLLGCLASQSYDKRQVAARTLGDIVKKLGEKVLPEIIPILEQGLESSQSEQRQGVCIGLSEIMSSTSREHVVVFADSLIPTVRKALCDPLHEVREAAAETFSNLHSNIGPRALDDILPSLLTALEDPDLSDYALDGLRQVMAIKSRVVLPYLVPQLTAPPVNTHALSFLSAVAGEALTKHLSKILPALMLALSDKIGTDQEAEELSYCQSVVLSVTDETGVRTVLDDLLASSSNQNAALRCAAVTILKAFCEQTKVDYTDHVPQLFRGLILLLTDDDPAVLLATWECLNAVTKKLDSSEMLGHIGNVRQALRFAVSDFHGQEIPGFCIPKKGITPLLPIFREGILNGAPELKESAAIGLGEILKRTSAEALKPSVVNITGPLIRILGDRFSYQVKVAVLETLGLLLGKCGAMLKPFLPQLQTTFIKALNDPNRSVRLKAATALGKLIAIHTRVDPLFQELHTLIKSTDDTSIRDTTLQALRGCIVGAGNKMSDKIRGEFVGTLESHLSSPEDTTRTTAAACLGALCSYLSPEERTTVLNMNLLDSDESQDWTLRHGRSVGLSIALKHGAELLTSDAYLRKVHSAVKSYAGADRVPIRLSGLRCVGFLLRHEVLSGQEISQILLDLLLKAMKQESNEVKQLGAQITSYVAKSKSEPISLSTRRILVPMLVNGTKEKNTLVRTNSELGLVHLLHLKQGEDVYKETLQSLESGMKDSLVDVHSKLSKRLPSMPDQEEDIDDTLLI